MIVTETILLFATPIRIFSISRLTTSSCYEPLPDKVKELFFKKVMGRVTKLERSDDRKSEK